MASKQQEFPRAKRVFINNIDSYSSRNIAKYLSTCAVGQSLIETPEDDEDEKVGNILLQNSFQVVGTVRNYKKLNRFALEQYSALNRAELLKLLMDCDIIVYNITEDPETIDEATWAISGLHSEIKYFPSPKMFILVSTLMTWANIKPADPDYPDTPITEEDYTRRRPHPNFKAHASAEKLVLKLGKTKKSRLATYVIAAGLQYGMGEGIFHFFFKASWLGELSTIPILDPGTNIIPTIHVNDLASVVQNVIDHKPRVHYFIAVDDSHHSLEDIVKAIAYELGPGEVQKDSSACLTRELTRSELDNLGINLCIEPIILKNRLNVSWLCESGIVDNISRVVEEYKQTRRLLPIKICLIGPPAVGKSSVAEQICKHYKIHHITVKETVEEKVKHLEKMLQKGADDNETEEVLHKAQDLLDSLKDRLSQIGDQPDDRTVMNIIREKLLSKTCRNHGFVLDGYPTTYEQATELFFDKDMEPLNTRSKLQSYNKMIIPEYIFSLEATDEFLKKRVQSLGEIVAEEMHYTQNEFLQRLSRFREMDTEDETVLNYFDELEIHPESIEIVNDTKKEDVMKKIMQSVGDALNYGSTLEEQEDEQMKQTIESQHGQAESMLREAEEKAVTLMEEWNRNVVEVKEQENELLEACAVPLRHYLMKNIVPTLTLGLLECCKIKPDDPVDFLAEFLLKNNAED